MLDVDPHHVDFRGVYCRHLAVVSFFHLSQKVYPSASKGFHNTIFQCKDMNNNQNCTLYSAVFCTIEDADLSGIPATDRPNKKRCGDCCNVFLLAERKGFEPLKRF